MYRKIIAIVIPACIAVAILGYMIWSVWGQLLEAFSHILPVYLVIALIICTAGWFLRGWRYQRILSGLETTVSLRTATGCILVSQTVNLIVPLRLGDLVRIFILNHENGTAYSAGISSIVVERVFDIATIALLGLITLPFVLNVDPAYRTVIWLILILCAAFFLFLILVNRFTSENRYLQIILNMLSEIRKVSLTPSSIILLGCISVVIWFSDILACLAVVLMFQQQASIATVIFAIVVGNLIKAVPLTPGGFGTYEYLVAETFSLAGMPDVYAKLVAIIDHLIKNLVTLIGGTISIYLFGDWVMPSIRKILNTRLDGGSPPGP